MKKIRRNKPPTINEIQTFLRNINFNLPVGFIDFFKETNGADINMDKNYVILWPLTDMIKLNEDYKVEEYAPEFFVFGSDGGNMAYALERRTGYVFEIPFVGMSNEEAVLKSKKFEDFIGKSN